MSDTDPRQRLHHLDVTSPPPMHPLLIEDVPGENGLAVSSSVRVSAAPVEVVLPGQVIETDSGPCYLVETCYPLTERHGASTLGSLLHCSPRTAMQLAREWDASSMDLACLAFLDIETTGLAGGAGTLAFLVGIGVFEGESFVLRQYFLRDPSEEFALLRELEGVLTNCSGVVTFNGRSFDLPLLASRFTLSRLHAHFQQLAHLDLLYPARRLWRGRTTDCSLSTLEREVLGLRRTGEDVPGRLIPRIYTDYLRTGDTREIKRVVYHNAFDIFSLVALATRLLQVFADPLADSRTGADCLRLALWLEDNGQSSEAARAYQAALARSLSSAHQALALKRFAAFLKRADRRAEAVPLWEQLAELCSDTQAPYVEIAKYYEWHAGSLSPAIHWIERAMSRVQSGPPTSQRETEIAALQHRLYRLLRKRDKTRMKAERQR